MKQNSNEMKQKSNHEMRSIATEMKLNETKSNQMTMKIKRKQDQIR